MRIQSKTTCNLSYHINGQRVLIPAGATLELQDEAYPDASKVLGAAVKKGTLVFLKAPKLSKEAQAKKDAEELAAAEALVAAAKKKK